MNNKMATTETIRVGDCVIMTGGVGKGCAGRVSEIKGNRAKVRISKMTYVHCLVGQCERANLGVHPATEDWRNSI